MHSIRSWETLFPTPDLSSLAPDPYFFHRITLEFPCPISNLHEEVTKVSPSPNMLWGLKNYMETFNKS